MIKWQWRTFNELTSKELYDILALRQEVFLLEQACLYPDLDYFDQKAMHLLGWEDGKLIAYARVFDKDIRYPDSLSVGRVVTSPKLRGRGIGKELMRQVLIHTEQHLSETSITISAQLYLKNFYESFGFKVIGEPYDEDGIPHIKMIKPNENC